jgi:hypothetical protein
MAGECCCTTFAPTPGPVSIETVEEELGKLKQLRSLQLPSSLSTAQFVNVRACKISGVLRVLSLQVKCSATDTELRDGVKIGDHGGAVVHAFFRIGPIHHKRVGPAAAAVDGLLAVVQVTRHLRRVDSRRGAV